MTGLRQWTRDPEIPARAGDEGLRPPGREELRQLVVRHLLTAGAPGVQELDWEYARWKPGVSLTSVHRLSFEDGSQELAVVKRYCGDKAQILAERPLSAERPPGLAQALRARAVLPESSMVLFTPPADRELGLRYLLDIKRFPKLLGDSGLVEPGLVRKRQTVFELARYKPERRAVYRVRVGLRDEQRTRFSVAVRVLPPAEAERVLHRRTAFEASGGGVLTPRLACAHPRHGLLVEPWLELQATAPDDFSGAEAAGALLAHLHAVPLPARGALQDEPATAPDPGDLLGLCGEDPRLGAGLARCLRPAGGSARTWVHGDFHPDQVARTSGGLLLMDLDGLRPGDPADDLASWIADHLHEHPDSAFDAAAGPLLEGYAQAGGALPAERELRAVTASALAARAAASLRRLELNALERARTALARATDLAGA